MHGKSQLVSLSDYEPCSGVGESRQSPDPSKFVRAVSWRGNSNILAATNWGHIKVCDMYHDTSLIHALAGVGYIVLLRRQSRIHLIYTG